MDSFDYSEAFRKNEKEANYYSARCMLVLAFVVALIWLLNILGVFIVPAKIMAVAGVSGIILFVLPSLLVKVLEYSPRLKFYIMLCCILGITFLSSALPSHAILAWAIPIALSCHYYEKKFSYLLLCFSIVCMSASLIIGTYHGEWDSNLLKALASSGERIVTKETIRRIVIFYIIPRSMILFGLTVVCSTLATRTRSLLIEQVKETKEKQQIVSELEVATHIQTSILPSVFPAFPERKEFDIYARMTPAKEVGGDFYDFFFVDDDHLALVIADVSGKGVPAALFMVIAKTLIKDRAQLGLSPEGVFEKVNNLLSQSNDEGLFVTAWMGIVEISSGTLTCVNAGHNPPLLAHGGKGFEYLKTRSGFVLAGLEGSRYTPFTLKLESGDTLFLYTDGVTEATDSKNELYGEERLKDALNRNITLEPEKLVGSIKEDVDSFVKDAAQFDDITMLAFSYHPEGGDSVE